MTNKFISFSGGVESSAMCVLYGNKADAIFADTGYEHQALYKRLDVVEKAVQKFHNNNFKIIRIKNDKEKSLPEYIKKSKTYPSFKMRFCTRMFKIEPIDNFLKQFESSELMIGLNSEEASKRIGNLGKVKTVNYVYPLVEAGLNRTMCESILEKLDLLPNFPAYMSRGGCIGCFYKSKKEYEAMIRLNPAEYDQVMNLEEEIQDRRERFYSLKDTISQGLRQYKKEIEQQTTFFDFKEIYEQSNIMPEQCGVFCHR